MVYRVQLDNFQGPLDLLLFFIRRDELDIMDIPIARITNEYLSYLEALQTLNVTIAGEFIVMAATLMQIKAKMLLPRVSIGSGEEIEDPRTELVHRLLEYQRFKEAAGGLAQRINSHNRLFPRPNSEVFEGMEKEPSYYIEEISLFDMVRIFKDLLDRMPRSLPYEMQREEIHIKEQIAFLIAKFVDRRKYSFSELFPSFASRQELIVTFLAILELIRTGQIRVSQKGIFDDFVLERVPHDPLERHNA